MIIYKALRVLINNVFIGCRYAINLIAGNNINIVGVDNSSDDRIDVTISCSGGGGGTMNHNELNNLSYETSGHTGFQKTLQYDSILGCFLNNL